MSRPLPGGVTPNLLISPVAGLVRDPLGKREPTVPR